MGALNACVVSAICLSVKVCLWKRGCVFLLTVRQTGVWERVGVICAGCIVSELRYQRDTCPTKKLGLQKRGTNWFKNSKIIAVGQLEFVKWIHSLTGLIY